MILDTINERIEIKKVGSKYMGRCPFHDEKTASFYVFTDSEKYHCFGCGAHGDEIDFIQKFHQVDFQEALKILGIDSKFKPDPLKRKRKFKLDRILFEVIWDKCKEDAGVIDLYKNHDNSDVRYYAERFNRTWSKSYAWYQLIKEATFTQLQRASPEQTSSRSWTNQEIQQFWDYVTLLDKEYERMNLEAITHKSITMSFLK